MNGGNQKHNPFRAAAVVGAALIGGLLLMACSGDGDTDTIGAEETSGEGATSEVSTSGSADSDTTTTEATASDTADGETTTSGTSGSDTSGGETTVTTSGLRTSTTAAQTFRIDLVIRAVVPAGQTDRPPVPADLVGPLGFVEGVVEVTPGAVADGGQGYDEISVQLGAAQDPGRVAGRILEVIGDEYQVTEAKRPASPGPDATTGTSLDSVDD